MTCTRKIYTTDNHVGERRRRRRRGGIFTKIKIVYVDMSQEKETEKITSKK